MGLFSSKKEGGFMDVIRCDEDDYLVWKWRPNGQDLNSTKKENSIRYGSRLHVKDGELAVFVYKQDNGTQQDFIEGPYDGKIETANFPILTSIVGLAFGGDSPFQAEVYFINLQGNNQVRFGVPFFDVFDPRFLDFAVPMAARGTLTFNITDYRGFIKQNRLVNFDKDDFSLQIQDAVRRYVKGFISNAPSDYGIPVLQIERRILDINTMIHQNLAPIFANDFGVNLKRLDLSAIEVDKESDGYIELRSVTADIQAATTTAQAEINIKNMADMQQINADNMAESLRVQREEMQRAQRLQTETNFIGAHALDQQADVLKTAAGNLGSMSSMGGGGGMNPAGMMTGMMLGGAMGGQMMNMMNQMGGQMQQSMAAPPPLPTVAYFVAVNGQQSGPFNMQQLQQLVQQGQINAQTMVWKQGMAAWAAAGSVDELAQLFMVATPPPMPPTPPTPPTPPVPPVPPTL